MPKSPRISKKQQTGGKKARGKPFPPGQSGNPEGRPPLTPDQRQFRDLCKEKSVAALNRIEMIAKKQGTAALQANQYLIDRAYGRPTQQTEITGPEGGPLEVQRRLNPKDLSDEELQQLRAIVGRAGVPPASSDG